jgi:hypothetical protein
LSFVFDDTSFLNFFLITISMFAVAATQANKQLKYLEKVTSEFLYL